MPKEILAVGDAIGGFFAHPVVQIGLRAIAIYVVVLWLAGAYWAFRDMQLRTENPILPYFAASLIIVFTPLFFPFAILVYRIVRPQERIGEVYERTLAEEALLAEVEAIRACPTCGRRVHEEWIICPICRTRLNRVCPNCERLVGLDWSLCAWCGKDFERREVVTGLEPRRAMPAGRGDDLDLEATTTRPAAGLATAVATDPVARTDARARRVEPRAAPRPSVPAPRSLRAPGSGAGRPAPDPLPEP